MIGGTVVEIIKLDDKVWVNCVEDDSNLKCAIYIDRNAKSESIEPGDCVWWQGGWAMWTPYKNRGGKNMNHKSGKDYDIKISRIGFSGVHKPAINNSGKES